MNSMAAAANAAAFRDFCAQRNPRSMAAAANAAAFRDFCAQRNPR
jgi:hypothetical protein